MKRNRVLVTGVALISALALDAKTHFKRLLNGESGVRLSMRSEFQDYPARLEARVTGFDRHLWIQNRTLRKLLSENAAHCVAAAGQLLEDAGVTSCDPLLQQCGLYIGSPAINIDPEVFIPALKESLGSEGSFEIARFAKRGMKLLDPLFLVKALPNIGLGGISVQHQVLGPNANITNGATSGVLAVTMAMAAIQRGTADCAIAGGYDSLLTMDSVAEGIISSRLSRRCADPEHACRPFDLHRDGHAVGEGAALVFLESEAHAHARSARIYGELLSASYTTNPHQWQQPENIDSTWLEQAARQVLRQYNGTPQDLDVIFGDGLATEWDDLREASAVARLVDRAPVLFTAATAAIGFTGAASGVFSIVHALLALHQSVVPPLTTCYQPDPRCPLNIATNVVRRDARHALVLNSDRGIKNMAVLVGARSQR